MGTYYISLNDQEEPFTDVRVRKALSLAIDRDYVANTIMQGIYTPATALVGPGIVDENGYFMDNANGGEPYISDDYAANLEEAKSLLAEAGYPDGEGFPTITYSANDAGYHIPVAEYLQQAWGELGITVNIDKVEWASFLPMRRAGDYDISRNGWSMDYNDPSNMLELFTTNNGNNDGKYANPEFDQVIEDSRVADKTTHFEKLHEAEDILMNDAACIPVAYYNDFWLQSPSLKGTWHSPYGYWYLQYGYIEVIDLPHNHPPHTEPQKSPLPFGEGIFAKKGGPWRGAIHPYKTYAPRVAAMTALIVCMRFSASWKTMDCGPLKTSSVTSMASRLTFLAHLLAHGGLVVVVGGQAVHEHGGLGLRHQLGVDLIGGQGVDALGPDFHRLAHADPHVGVDDIRTGHSVGVLGQGDAGAAALGKLFALFPPGRGQASKPWGRRPRSACPSWRSRSSGCCPCCSGRRPCRQT